MAQMKNLRTAIENADKQIELLRTAMNEIESSEWYSGDYIRLIKNKL